MTNTKRCQVVLLGALCLSLVQPTFAQTPTATVSALPRLVRFGGTVKDPSGAPLTGVVGITFALYAEQTGGAPLWLETQNLTPDSTGHYSALLGSAKTEGLPAELFTSEQAHWVGVQVEGQPEQPRVLLVSTPYALKAGDAETIGGLPPSAFVLAAPATVASASPSTPVSDASPAATPAVSGTGIADFIPLWSTATKLGSSVLFQSGTGATAEVGINTGTPTSTLDVNGTTTLGGATTLPATGTATASAGDNSQPLDLVASAFDKATSTAVAETFQLQAEPVGNDTGKPGGVLSLLYGSGTSTPAETGLKIASNGQITFATGQTFPGQGGSGTVTSVTAGTGLTASPNPITSSGTLSLTPSACAAGSALSGLPLTCSPFATLGANTFSGNQSVTGGVTASGTVQGGTVNSTTTLNINGSAVIQTDNGSNLSVGSQGTGYGTGSVSSNTFVGQTTAAGNTGSANTAVGYSAGGGCEGFCSGASGSSNTAVGYTAMTDNSTGGNNTAVGSSAMVQNTAGGNNTATGYQALQGNTSGSNNTAVGYNAMADYSSTPGTGGNNTAIGYEALQANTGGTNNTASGYQAMYSNTTGYYNVASGYQAMYSGTGAAYNTASGFQALMTTNGVGNTAFGSSALANATTGGSNIGIGNQGGLNVTTGGDNIEIGNAGTSSDNGVIRIGTQGTQTSAYMAGIYGVNSSGIAVYINSNGQLGTVSSSRRYKEDIHDMADASSGLLRLRPVTFRYKQAFADGSKPVQYGLIAEEVAEVYPDLVARTADGQIETVKYQVLDSMLLNELQRQNNTIEAQKEQIREQGQQIHSLEDRLTKLEAALEGSAASGSSH